MISGHSLYFRLFWLLALADFGGQAAAQSITLTYVGARTIATGTTVGGVEFGGISGISYNPYTDRFVAVTDDSRAAGLDPRARDTAGTPAADVSGGWFTLTYRRDASRTDITCQVESSGDLGQPGWLPISDEYVGNEGGFEWRRASVPLSEGRKFLRLRVRRLF